MQVHDSTRTSVSLKINLKKSPQLDTESSSKSVISRDSIENDAPISHPRPFELLDMQDSLGNLLFSQAAPLWLNTHKPYIHSNTFRHYQAYVAALSDFFGPMTCGRIGLGELRGYQRWRSSLYSADSDAELPLDSALLTSRFRHGAGPVRIKNEINACLKPILKECGTWNEIKRRGFRHLPVPKGEGAGVALDREETAKMLAVAFSKSRWALAANCLRIMYRTGSGFGEMRKMRRKDVDLGHATMRVVEGAKLDPRVRIVALVPSALDSMAWLVERWTDLGGSSPDDYLLPHRKHGFKQPMVSIYFAWHAIKAECLKLHPEMADKLALLRIYDGRVSAASLLLGNEKLSLPTIEKALGWSPNSKMRERYHRKGINEQREALLTLEETG